jgi:segregation and condensation protein A
MYKIRTEQFEGPLDLLLQLIEKTELDITEVALSEVTEQFLNYMEQIEEKKPNEVADFLVVASRLLLVKSRILLPAVSHEDDQEEIILESQLKIYKKFFEASREIEKEILKGHFLYTREKIPIKVDKMFNPPKKMNNEMMKKVFLNVLGKLEPVVKLPEKNIKRVISIKEKIGSIRERLLDKIQINFSDLVSGSQNKADTIITFLSILELVKQREAAVVQDSKFGEIIVSKK